MESKPALFWEQLYLLGENKLQSQLSLRMLTLNGTAWCCLLGPQVDSHARIDQGGVFIRHSEMSPSPPSIQAGTTPWEEGYDYPVLDPIELGLSELLPLSPFFLTEQVFQDSVLGIQQLSASSSRKKESQSSPVMGLTVTSTSHPSPKPSSLSFSHAHPPAGLIQSLAVSFCFGSSKSQLHS